MTNLLDIIRGKLARGGQMNGGEIKLIVRDVVNLVESLQEKINELETKLDSVARRSDSGSKKASPKSKVQPESDK